jgi:hypothetical protein
MLTWAGTDAQVTNSGTPTASTKHVFSQSTATQSPCRKNAQQLHVGT